MLWPSILILAAFLVFGGVISFLFILPLIVVATNIIILYFFFLRIYTEITKYRRGDVYAYSYAAAALILVIVNNFLPLWWITTCTIFAFIIAHLYLTLKK